MFTGIITHVGKLETIENDRFTFSAPVGFSRNLTKGTSVAVNGACLTVITKPSTTTFTVEIMPETKKRTTLGMFKEQDLANLELPATPETFLSGHIVQGHIDGVGKISNVKREGNSHILTVNVPPNLTRYIVAKGSIAINGVALTVITVIKDTFTVGIVPYTWKHTMFHSLKIGERVNIEVDILAKYVEKLV